MSKKTENIKRKNIKRKSIKKKSIKRKSMKHGGSQSENEKHNDEHQNKQGERSTEIQEILNKEAPNIFIPPKPTVGGPSYRDDNWKGRSVLIAILVAGGTLGVHAALSSL